MKKRLKNDGETVKEVIFKDVIISDVFFKETIFPDIVVSDKKVFERNILEVEFEDSKNIEKTSRKRRKNAK